MNRPKTPAQKVGEWQMVYRAVLDELLAGVEALRLVRSREITVIEGYLIADRRTAAIVAAMLVGQNVRLPVETLTEEATERD